MPNLCLRSRNLKENESGRKAAWPRGESNFAPRGRHATTCGPDKTPETIHVDLAIKARWEEREEHSLRSSDSLERERDPTRD